MPSITLSSKSNVFDGAKGSRLNQFSFIFIDYLVVAGGGGGAGVNTGNPGSNFGCAGGGAGGYITSYRGDGTELSGRNSTPPLPQEIFKGTSYTVTVGSGGAGNAKGGDSVFGSITAEGGGIGRAGSGGSGGGGDFSGVAGNGTTNQGFDGGAQINTAQGGGGGGASEAGNTDGSSTGGDGLSSSINGSPTIRAGGGAAGNTSTVASGGDGGGATGRNTTGNGNNGTANTGGGGGGACINNSSGNFTGGSGGSGIVILRYPNYLTISVGAGLTSSTANVGSDKVTTFTAGTDTVSFS